MPAPQCVILVPANNGIEPACDHSLRQLERIMREIRRRTRVVGAFPDGRSALMLVSARLRHIAGTKWGTRPHLDMERLREPAEDTEQPATA